MTTIQSEFNSYTAGLTHIVRTKCLQFYIFLNFHPLVHDYLDETWAGLVRVDCTV